MEKCCNNCCECCKDKNFNIANLQSLYWKDDLEFKREVSAFMIPDQKILSITTDNNASGVTFDWPYIWNKIKNMKEMPEKVIMIHTHPVDHIQLSSIDENMVKGWRKALGVPIDFYVISKYRNIDYEDRPRVTGTFYKYICHKNNENKTSLYLNRSDLLRELDPSLQVISNILYGLSRYEKDLTFCDLEKIRAVIN